MTSRTAAPLSDVFAECAARRGADVAALTARSAWETFADFAAVEVEAPAGADPEALLCQWGTFTRTGAPRFTLVLTRQVAVDTGGDAPEYEQLDCRLTYPPDPALDGLDRFESWWSADGGTPAADWVAQVGDRPEWAALADVAPEGVEVRTERV